jgi:hypothetical protein
MNKNCEILQLYFWIKCLIEIILSLGLQKERPSLRPLKEIIQHFKQYRTNYFSVGHFRSAGFGSGSAFTMQIRLNVINADLNPDPQHSFLL